MGHLRYYFSMPKKEVTVQKMLARLRNDPKFIDIWARAYHHPEHRGACIQEARRLFKLSPYWEEVILPIQFNCSPDGVVIVEMNQPVHESYDKITQRMMYTIPIYPESTLEDVRKAYGDIIKKYRQLGYKVDVRASTQDEIQYRTLALHEAGKENQDIAEAISDEFDTIILKEEVPKLIRRCYGKQ